MAIIIRRLQDSEIGLANDFFNSIYKSNRSLEHFRWEFLQGPFGPAVYVVAIDDAITPEIRVVGIQCAIPIALQKVNEKNIVLTAKSEDTLVHPEYRGQKIFERMYDLLFEECKRVGIKFIWGFTPARKAFERIGFQIPFETQQALMVFDPLKAYRYLSSLNVNNRIFDRCKIAGLSLISKMLAVFTSRRPTLNLVINKIDITSKESVIGELCPNSTLHYLKMNHDYINWRLKNNPYNNTYENYQFFSGPTLLADIIVNFRRGGFGYIEQMIIRDGLPAAAENEVMRHLVAIMKRRTSVVRVLLFDTNDVLRRQTSLLKGSGFFILKRGSHFVWRQLNSVELNSEEIFFTRLFTQGNQ